MQSMTPWQMAGIAFGLAVYVLAWFRGGRPERLGAGVFVVTFVVSAIIFDWEIGGFFWAALVLDCARLVIFGWLCFRYDRWWLLVVTAAVGLTVLAHALRLLDPGFSQVALASSAVGLGYVIDLALLLGVWERRLAGEPPAGPAAWAAAARIKAMRRDGTACPPDTAGRSATTAVASKDLGRGAGCEPAEARSR